jgi:putative ABC transport system permease protein
MIDAFVRDARLAARTLRRAPGFAVTAVLTLALGIGLATAVFTVADAVLLRRLPLREQDRVVVLHGAVPSRGMDNVPLYLDQAREFGRRSRALERAAFFLYNGAAPVAVRDQGTVSRLSVALVSGEYFSVLGARPLVGRALRAEDDAAGATPVLVLSHRAWQRRFGGAPDVVGRRIELHEYARAYKVVGVMPPGVDWPRGTDAWTPVLATIPPEGVGYVSLDVVGRLAPGAPIAAARHEMTGYFHREGASAFEREVQGVARTLPDLVLGDVRPAVLAFAGAAGLLLLITCVNVANLLLVRGLGRVREVAVRTALGASRGRVIAGLLAEHAILALAGGVLGVLVAWLAVRGFVLAAPAGLPRLDEVSVNGRALAGALAVTTAATLVFAVAPALVASRVDVREALRSGARETGSRRARAAREALVAVQVALALLVLSASLLLGRSLLRLQRADLAFEPSQVVVAELALRGDQYDTGPKQAALLERLVPAVRALPGVRAASPVVSVPYASTRSWEGRPRAEGQSAEEAARNPMIDIEVVGPGFFEALGLPVTRGRGFTDADRPGAPPAVVLSESAARHYWPGADPVGKRVLVGLPSTPPATVVGVVPDPRYRDLREPHATIYFPLAQSAFPFAPTTLLLRTTRAPADIAAALRGVLAEAAPGVALASLAPFEDLLAGPLAQPRLNALLLAAFALAAVALAAVGLFGVLATMVRQRTREIGVRMALGATPAAVTRLVLRRGLLLAAAGTAAGLLLALAANRLLAALLFGVSSTDAVTLGAAALGLLAVAALASLLPARAGGRVDPAVALRAE